MCFGNYKIVCLITAFVCFRSDKIVCQITFTPCCAGMFSSCRIRSDSKTTGLTLTTGVRWICMKRRDASNMNIHYGFTGLLSAVWKVTLKSTCLGCLSWPGKRGVVYSSRCLPVPGNLIDEYGMF